MSACILKVFEFKKPLKGDKVHYLVMVIVKAYI